MLEYYRRFATSTAFARPPLALKSAVAVSSISRTKENTEGDNLQWMEEERRYREVWADEDEVTWE